LWDLFTCFIQIEIKNISLADSTIPFDDYINNINQFTSFYKIFENITFRRTYIIDSIYADEWGTSAYE
jgi:hypothetical protein